MESNEIETKSWTDDLPLCTNCGAGAATNQAYRPDGARHEIFSFRDRSFHYNADTNTSLYAIFSGENGSNVATFAMQKIAADVLWGGLTGKTTDDEVKEVLRQSFLSAEKAYFNSIDGLLARKTMLQDNVPDGISEYEFSQKYKELYDNIETINQELAVGSSAVLVLIHFSKLYVCSIGNCRALLCRNDTNQSLRIDQLSIDHNLQNEEEIQRLRRLGLDIDVLRSSTLESTRCIGNYFGKSGYKDCNFLSDATSEPIIFQPEIIGGIPMDDSCRFLVIMSGGMCNTLHEIFSMQANKEIIQMTVEQFTTQSTLMGVAQSVVNKIVQLHHDMFMKHIDENNRSSFKSHNDVTLLVRNFNFPLPNAIQKRNSQVRFNPVISEHPSAAVQYTESEINSIFGTNLSSVYSTNDSSSSDYNRDQSMVIDRNKKIAPYVDFTDYFKRVEEAKANNTLPKNIQFD